MKRKIKKLKRLVEEYCQYTRWDAVNILTHRKFIYIVWMSPQYWKGKTPDEDMCELVYTMRVFPDSEISKRIKSYRQKIYREKKKEENGDSFIQKVRDEIFPKTIFKEAKEKKD